ncbi:hypothetical protein HH310_23250 [Actinoplanes sp. TBRC 11911]|uniref:DUF6331 family protein n=1 Tax=Actinoplanes sp. TBRC 11911 TaxID=2729386 RepID=UPI00145D8CD0|nr:DUF6331 family protein [Actinoplanes sp. TBRC 11911]NMO54088.1 hypothetical protein [Actinoplanes sp. TBRC 11911]
MMDVTVEIPSPLRECIIACEVVCVRGCCGIDAVSTDRDLIDAWCREVGPDATIDAHRQLADLIDLVEDRSNLVTSTFLNHRTINDAARLELLNFLAAFEVGLSDSFASRASWSIEDF